ncbi:hypothetical protein [Tumebacillus lipolyticus]|uniref:Uncharacterized protein n=1 Tax=Tumebacillus lipolyticus TaxID=1280370 RepID=A0ABW5A2I9_9BACL
MLKRNRAKQTIVQNMLVIAIGPSGVVQIGDVWEGVDPFSYGEAYSGYRGAPGFAIVGKFEEPINTQLHYANQVDEDVRDQDVVGKDVEVFLPNTRGVEAR